MSACEIPWSALIALIGVLSVIGGVTVGYAVGYERGRREMRQ